MVNKARNKGTKAETAVCRHMQANGFPFADRRPLAGNLDRGDLLVCPGIIAEIKAHKSYSDGDIRAWLAETAREKANANADIGVLIVKRAGKGEAQVGAWWAIVSENGAPLFRFLDDFLRQLREHGWGSPLDGDTA